MLHWFLLHALHCSGHCQPAHFTYAKKSCIQYTSLNITTFSQSLSRLVICHCVHLLSVRKCVQTLRWPQKLLIIMLWYDKKVKLTSSGATFVAGEHLVLMNSEPSRLYASLWSFHASLNLSQNPMYMSLALKNEKELLAVCTHTVVNFWHFWSINSSLNSGS